MTPGTVTRQAPLSMEFSRQEYRSRLPFPSPGDLLGPGIRPRSPALQAGSLLSKPAGKTLESPLNYKKIKPVNTKGNQPKIFIERNDAKTEALILWPPDVKN